MAITKTWEVNTMERDLSDGHVNKVIYRVKGIDDSDSTEKDRATGEVVFTKPDSLPSDFKAYDTLDEATVLGWVKTKLNEETDLDGKAVDRVALIEKALEDNIALINTPVTATGKPF